MLGRGRSSTGYGCRGAEEKTHGEKGARNIYIIGEDLSQLVPERTVNRTAVLVLVLVLDVYMYYRMCVYSSRGGTDTESQ